jgi:hypothetical protein
MNEECGRRDLLGSGIPPWLLWVLPIATIALLVMSVACFANARRCGRTHCYFTAPFFLLMAVASLLHGLGIVPLGPQGWSYIGIVLLTGGTLLCLLTEWVWGRYRAR